MTDEPTTTGPADPAPATPTVSPRRQTLRHLGASLAALAMPTILALGVLLAVGRDQHLHGSATWTVVVLAIGLVPCVVLAGLSLGALRSARMRRAVRPIEAGVLAWLVVSLVVAVFGGVAFVDAFSTGAFVGVAAALVVAFVQPLVEGRRTGRRVMVGTFVVVLGLGGWGTAVFAGVFDHHGEIWLTPDGSEPQRAVLGYVDDGGVLLGQAGPVPAPLDAGYADALPHGLGAGAVHPATNPGPVGYGAVPAPAPMAVPTTLIPPLARWATLRARTDGRLELTLDRAVAGRLRVPIEVRVQRGGCGGRDERAAVGSWSWPAGAVGVDRTILPLRLADLRIDTRLAVVVGARAPLAATRCADLVTGLGVALASLGGASFHRDCVAPLELAPAEEQLLAPSSFTDAECADRLERLGGVLAGAVVPTAHAAGVRTCIARASDHEREQPVEHAVPGGVAIERQDLVSIDDPLAACTGRWHEPLAWPVEPSDPNAQGAFPASAVVGESHGDAVGTAEAIH